MSSTAGTGFKQELFAEIARVAKALAHGHRLELLEFLAQGERSVDELAKASGLSLANASQHLQQLRQAGLVTARKDGLRVYCRLAGGDVQTLVSALRDTAERHVAEVQRLIDSYLTVKDSLEPIPAEELLERARKGVVTVIDVRPPEEYAAGHVPGAINVPLGELEKRLDLFNKRREIVAYCRGPYCVLSFEAVEKLRKKGFKARRLKDGLPEWRQAGLPVE